MFDEMKRCRHEKAILKAALKELLQQYRHMGGSVVYPKLIDRALNKVQRLEEAESYSEWVRLLTKEEIERHNIHV